MPQVGSVVLIFAVVFGGIYSVSSVLLDQNAKNLEIATGRQILKGLRRK